MGEEFPFFWRQMALWPGLEFFPAFTVHLSIKREFLNLLSHSGKGILLPDNYNSLLGLTVRGNYFGILKSTIEKSSEWMISRWVFLFLHYFLFFYFFSEVQEDTKSHGFSQIRL